MNRGITSIIAILIVTMILSGCTQSHSNAGINIWDPESGKYSMPERSLEYMIGIDSSWVVADTNQLPSGFEMCVIDQNTGVCVTLADISKTTGYEKEVTAYTSKELNDIVYSLLHHEGRLETIRNISFEPSKFMSGSAWCFQANVTVKEGSDTIDLLYRGYLFNNKDKAFMIVAVVAGIDTLDDVESFLSPYFNRLKHTDSKSRL